MGSTQKVTKASNPDWAEKLSFDIPPDAVLRVEVWADDTTGEVTDYIVGYCEVTMAQLVAPGTAGATAGAGSAAGSAAGSGSGDAGSVAGTASAASGGSGAVSACVFPLTLVEPRHSPSHAASHMGSPMLHGSPQLHVRHARSVEEVALEAATGTQWHLTASITNYLAVVVGAGVILVLVVSHGSC